MPRTKYQGSDERPRARSLLLEDDASPICESCGFEIPMTVYRNGKDICGRCYGLKMGYYADPDEAASHLSTAHERRRRL